MLETKKQKRNLCQKPAKAKAKAKTVLSPLITCDYRKTENPTESETTRHRTENLSLPALNTKEARRSQRAVDTGNLHPPAPAHAAAARCSCGSHAGRGARRSAGPVGRRDTRVAPLSLAEESKPQAECNQTA